MTTKLKYEYLDLRGLRIPDEKIIRLLDESNRTEQQIIDFLGYERMEINGAAEHFLNMLSSQEKYFQQMDSLEKVFNKSRQK